MADMGAKDLGQTVKMKLRVLATTDLHAHVLSWSYDTNKAAPARGLSRVATLIHQARAEVENCLLFDNGDFLNGSGLSMAMLDLFPDLPPHPMVAAMNHLHYDAVAVGNHEFSNGINFFQAAVKDAEFPLVCSNFAFQGLDQILPHTLLTRRMRDEQGGAHDLKIGVLALLPRQTLVWEQRHLAGIAQAVPMMQAAKSTSHALRDQGADIVVALVHSGFDADAALESEESLAMAVAKIPAITAVLAGHSHKVFPPEPAAFAQDAALVAPGFFGSHLGVIDLDLHQTATGWAQVARRSLVRPVARRMARGSTLVPLVTEDPQIQKLAAPVHSAVTRATGKVIGRSSHRLHSYFALITDCAALNLVAQTQIDFIRSRLIDPRFQHIPILAAAAPFKAGGRGGPENYTDLMPGPLRVHQITDLYTHPNHLVAFLVTGAVITQWLERAVSLFHQIDPGQKDAALIDCNFPSFNFEVLFGVGYQINLSQPARYDASGNVIHPNAHRIQDLTHNGAPVTQDQPFILVSNSYRRDGLAGFSGTMAENILFESWSQVRILIQDQIARGAPLPAVNPRRWHFRPMPATSVIFETNPKAVDLVSEVAHLRPEPLEILETGFRRFRLHL
jgi:2',3'-cyclic-nucleotide 2'-phosphodiesterase/3'-nucleotidase